MLGIAPLSTLPVSDTEEGTSNAPQLGDPDYPIIDGATTPNAIEDNNSNMGLEEDV